MKKISSLLHFAIRSKNAVIGYNSLLASSAKKMGLIIIDEGTSENSIKKIIKTFPDTKINIMAEPGNLISKSSVKIIGVKTSEFDKEIKKHLKSLEI
ncbi:MAG: hypothetical protein JXR69_04950 [Candidatus Delongbacteria bacterium]|nr:hypothetical protein [Candidatus Delongbacteria bacterium]